jgi:hypothetical protein
LVFSFFFSLFLVAGDTGVAVTVAAVAIVTTVAVVASVAVVAAVVASPLSLRVEWSPDCMASEDTTEEILSIFPDIVSMSAGGHLFDGGGGGDGTSTVPVFVTDWDSTNLSMSLKFPTMWKLQGSSEGDAGNAGNDDAGGATSAPADGAGQGRVSGGTGDSIGGGDIEGVGDSSDEGAKSARDADGAVSDKGGANLS